MLCITRLLLSALLLVLAIPAGADYGPDAQPNNPTNNGNGDNPANAGQQMKVPDYIKPGFQMLFYNGSSTEAPQPDKIGSAGMGFTEYTIIAVSKDKVFVTATNYLAVDGVPLTAQGEIDTTQDPKVQFIGSNSFAITAMDVQGGNAMWMPVDALKQWQSGNGVEVVRGQWPYQGKQVNAATITVKGNNLISSNTYDSDDGLKLASRNASGNFRRNATGNDPYQRQMQSQMQLLSTRQMESPLLNAKWPNWAKAVKKMHYKGTYKMHTPGFDSPSLQISSTLEFTDRGANYVTGKSTITLQGGGQPDTKAILQGPGTLLGNWIHPDILNNLNEGQIDRNEILRTTLTYKVQQGRLGQLGVFVLTNDAKSFYNVSGYSLKDGSLTYINLHTADPATTVEASLDGIE
ncbi:MAG: hypothetical protein AB8C95_16205, partial [Phycisphaeraceae bacterium]